MSFLALLFIIICGFAIIMMIIKIVKKNKKNRYYNSCNSKYKYTGNNITKI